jgi:CRP/FNR family transcriptional regulator
VASVGTNRDSFKVRVLDSVLNILAVKSLTQIKKKKFQAKRIPAAESPFIFTGKRIDRQAMNKIQFLSRLPLFRGLPDGELRTLAEIAGARTYRRGETIFLDGGEGHGFYVVYTGKVKIFKLSSEGKELVLHILGPEDSFAEVPVFEGRHYPANAEAIDNTRVLFFPREALLQAIRRDPFLAMNMLAALSARLREFAQRMEDLLLKDVPSRLSAYLLHLSEQWKGSDELELDIKKGLLASLIGAKQESLSRILAKMSARRIIEVKGKRIRILDRQKLKKMAAGDRTLFN